MPAAALICGAHVLVTAAGVTTALSSSTDTDMRFTVPGGVVAFVTLESTALLCDVELSEYVRLPPPVVEPVPAPPTPMMPLELVPAGSVRLVFLSVLLIGRSVVPGPGRLYVVLFESDLLMSRSALT